MPSNILRARVESNGDGLAVSWEFDGGEVAVDVATGASPEGIDSKRTITVDAGQREARLAGTALAGPYVSLTPHGGGASLIAAERLVRFDGTFNFRDIGGYRVAGGGHTRWARVFRADSLHRLLPTDMARFERLGCQVVFDLRGDEERATNPNKVSAVAVPVIGRPPEEGLLTPDMSQLGTKAQGEGMLRHIYVGMLQYSASRFGTMFTAMAESSGLPAVFHCHAGKDRTGMVAALLLSALGVDRRDVLDDYELTSHYRTPDRLVESYDGLVGRGASAEAAAGVLGAPRWAMEEAMSALDTEYGGIEAFLKGPAGMTDAQLVALRAALTQVD